MDKWTRQQPAKNFDVTVEGKKKDTGNITTLMSWDSCKEKIRIQMYQELCN